jgi:hypothetical protein
MENNTHTINIAPLIDYMLAIYVVVQNLNEDGLDNATEVVDALAILAEHAANSVKQVSKPRI